MAVTVKIKAGTGLIIANQVKLPRFVDEYKRRATSLQGRHAKTGLFYA